MLCCLGLAAWGGCWGLLELASWKQLPELPGAGPLLLGLLGAGLSCLGCLCSALLCSALLPGLGGVCCAGLKGGDLLRLAARAELPGVCSALLPQLSCLASGLCWGAWPLSLAWPGWGWLLISGPFLDIFAERFWSMKSFFL